MSTTKIAIDGMHCRSCELTIERRLKALPGVTDVEADAAKGLARIRHDGEAPPLAAIDAAVREDGYRARTTGEPATPTAVPKRPGTLQLIGLFALVWLIIGIAKRAGLLDFAIATDSTAGFWAAFMLGLVAASTSCLAVVGGLLVSSSAAYNRRRPSASAFARMEPSFMFASGRVLSYALFGGLLGAVGAAARPSPAFTGAIIVIAAAYMLTMGLDMLGLAPAWLKALQPRMPKAIARRAIDAQGNEHPVMPFLLGGATFFVPCGFTQALQVFALTTGSFVWSAVILSAFALGTTPALLALGWVSNGLKGRLGAFLFRLSGALVVVLGLWNVQNGLTAMGYPLSLPDFRAAAPVSQLEDPNVVIVDGVQVIRMRLSVNPAYRPSDTYVIKAGMPVRMEIAGVGTGCRGELVVPKARARVALTEQLNVLEFTPKKTGDYVFSCSMGMFPGIMKAI